ncbi:MAG: TonB-dependent receptor [Acidobacteriia bacterium]|nr:TonB-dependent receptor [Terriglobia bacterium]
MNPTRWLWIVILFALCLSGRATAQVSSQTPSTGAGHDLSSLDLESLLNTKVITASKFSENLADAPGVISVISQDELRRFGGTTLQEVLERVPGLSLASAYFTDRSLIAARGDQTKINGGHVLFLINGRPTREVLEGGLISDLLEAFPVNALEKIEVIKGPGSVLYGSNAFSAVVNLITKKAESNGIAVSGLGGEQGAKGSSGQVMIKRGSFSLFGAGQFHQRPNWTTDYRLPVSLIGDPVAPVVPLVQNLTLEDRGDGAYLGASYKNLAFMSSFTEWHAPSFVRGSTASNKWRRGFADLGYTVKATNDWDMSFNATYTRNTFDNFGYPSIGRDSQELVLEWTNGVTFSNRDRLTFGALFNHVEGQETYFGIDPPFQISDGSRPGGAFYAQWDHQLVDTVKLVGGVQVNKIDGTGMNVVPRAGVVWNPTPHVGVKALYSGAFRAPSINETMLNHPGLQGNPDLKPEKVGTVDLSVSYQANRFQGALTYFHSRQTDSIVVDTQPVRWRYLNLGEATFEGFELESKYYLRKSFFLTGSVSYQANEDGNENYNVTPVPNFGAKAGLSYRAENGLTLSIFDNYQGALNGFSNTTVNPSPMAYHLLSSHFRYDLSRYLGSRDKGGVAFFAHAENLANYQVWLPDWGNNSGDTMPVNRGRTVYFGVEFSLGRE